MAEAQKSSTIAGALLPAALLPAALLLALFNRAASAHTRLLSDRACVEKTQSAALPPGVSLNGGSRAERDLIARAFAVKLRGLTLPDRRLTITIEPERDLRRHVHAEGDGAADSDIDGIYDAAAQPPDHASASPDSAACATITLLDGENSQAFLQTFMHEYGHHIWSQLTTEDISSFQKLYSAAQQAQSFVSDYASVSPEEDFAEAFAAYELHSQLLRQRDPSVEQFIAERLQRLRSDFSLQAAKARR